MVNTPTTERQFDLARLLKEELQSLGIDDCSVDEACNLIARLSGSTAGTPLGFMAHLDTSPDFSGEGVKPIIHRDYDGSVLKLGAGDVALDPAAFPMLTRYVGETIITTDGTTLLGADDKAGIAEIMTAVRYLVEHPELPRPDLEIAFTPDEETGQGMKAFPTKSLQSRFFLTVDGTDEGSIEAECFTAFKAIVTFTGRSIHPGEARGQLANAVSMASHYVSGLPRSESPEATDGVYGFYCPTEITGGIAQAEVRIIVRDFDMATVRRRLAFLETLATTVEGAFPGGSVRVATEQQYLNMAEFLAPYPELLERLKEAIQMTGMEPKLDSIRGGTDGARLSEKGVPTPNLFTGGQNFHGPREWIALPAMVRAAKTLINFAQLFAEP
jgi:tripeptide aminopeptidase